METSRYLDEYYGQGKEDGRLGSRHGSVEFITTMGYIEKYLKPGHRVIEIGAGTGRYSHALARKGYTVDAVELIQHNIDVFRQNTLDGENITVTQGNALDLSGFPDNTYDITLLLGPMYHLFTLEDKRQALREAIRVTKPGGLVFVAYIISDMAIMQAVFGYRGFSVAEHIKNGYIDPQTFAASSEPKLVFELVRKEDIDTLMSGFPVKRLHYLASDGWSEMLRDDIDKADDETFELYLQFHFAICERADMVGFTSHSLDIFRKD